LSSHGGRRGANVEWPGRGRVVRYGPSTDGKAG
jgi:hypothetical protein